MYVNNQWFADSFFIYLFFVISDIASEPNTVIIKQRSFVEYSKTITKNYFLQGFKANYCHKFQLKLYISSKAINHILIMPKNLNTVLY